MEGEEVQKLICSDRGRGQIGWSLFIFELLVA